MTPHVRHGLGDPRIPWVVVVDVATPDRPGSEAAIHALRAVADEASWPTPTAAAVVTGTRRELLGVLTADSTEVLRVGLHEQGLTVAARHDALDGLAMLTVVGRLIGGDVRSSARGVDTADRGRHPVRALAGRAWEVGARPQAAVARAVAGRAAGDSFASATIDAEPRTADLVHAGASAVVTWNRGHGARSTRVSVAVGASTVGGTSYELADRSALLRLRRVEQMTPEEVRDELRRAPLQPGPGAATRRPLVAAVTRLVLQAAAPRLGSTLLVSHLGTLAAPEPVHGVAFYPVTGGGSGLSLGAATLRGRTTLTLRARAERFDDEDLQMLLTLVIDALP